MLTNVLFLTTLGMCLAARTPGPAAATCTASSEQSCSDEQREERCRELASHPASNDVVTTLTGDSWCYCSHGTVRPCDDVCPEYAKHDEQARRACSSVCPDYWRCMELIGHAPSFEYDYIINGSSENGDVATRNDEDIADVALLRTNKSDAAACPRGVAYCGRNQNDDVPAHRLPLEGMLYCARLAVATAVLCVYYFALPLLLTGSQQA